MYINTIEDATKAMQAKVEYYKIRLEVWNTVKRARKKDGGDFANIERNFTTEKPIRVSIFRQYGLYKAVIYFYSRNEGYTDDTVYLPENAGVNEIESEIEKHKEKLRDWMTKAEKGREEIAGKIEQATPHIIALRAIIAAAKNSESHFEIEDYIKNHIG